MPVDTTGRSCCRMEVGAECVEGENSADIESDVRRDEGHQGYEGDALPSLKDPSWRRMSDQHRLTEGAGLMIAAYLHSP